jgi:hypothetical protein
MAPATAQMSKILPIFEEIQRPLIGRTVTGLGVH